MRTLYALILGLILISCCAVSSFAQNNPQTKPKSTKTRTITGCLAKGDSPDEYKLTAKNGAVFDLRSGGASAMSSAEKPVNLADHVGHTVTVTGTVEKHETPGMTEEKHEGKEGGMGKHEHGNKAIELNVISVKHVSDTCS